MTQTTEQDLVRFYTSLEEDVLKELVAASAQWERAQKDTDEEDCQFCYEVMNGEPEHTVECCEHYDVLNAAFNAVIDLDHRLNPDPISPHTGR